MSLDLNGSTALAESIKQQLGNVRRDWRVEAAEQRVQIVDGLRQLERGMLDLERLKNDIRERLATVKDGRDGIDGAPGKDGAPGRDGVDGNRGLDGKDGAPGRDGTNGIDGKDGQDGAPGRDGIDGKDGAPGRDGADGASGERGEQGPPGVFAAPLPFKAGAITYAGSLIYHEGSTFCALRDTAAAPPHADFQPVAYKGRDAYAGQACGLFDPSRSYRAMDVVVFNNSEWRAVRDNPGPCPGSDNAWVQGAKGSKGKPGEPGPRGEPGPTGLWLASVERVGAALIFTRTDGSMLSVDLVNYVEGIADALHGN